MIGLLCVIGIHRPEWVPAAGPGWAPPVRRCHDCHRPLGRQHRE